jgi:ankyrin repeat protein
VGVIFVERSRPFKKGDVMSKPCKVKGRYPNKTDEWGITDFMIACRYGNYNEVEFMIENDPDINKQDFMGWTSLMKASFGGYPKIVELLLSQNADPWLFSIDRENALQLAYYRRNGRIIEMLEDTMRKGKNAYKVS